MTPAWFGTNEVSDILACPDLLPPNGRLEQSLGGNAKNVPRFPSKPFFMSRTRRNGPVTYDALVQDLAEAKRQIEANLPAHSARAFAFPWWNGTQEAVRAVLEAGYKMAFWGLAHVSPGFGRNAVDPLRLGRLGFDWIHCLRGKGRTSVTRLLCQKIKGLHDDTN